MNNLFDLLDDFVLNLEEEGVPLQEILETMHEYLEVSEELSYENRF